MKKIAYFSSILSAFLLFFTACEDGDFGDKAANPQSWEQEELVTLSDLTATAVAPINLASVTGDSVNIASVSPITLTEGELVNHTLTLDGKHKLSLGSDYKASVAELQEMVTGSFGKRPEERSMMATLSVNVLVDGQASLLTSNSFELKITPKAPFIASAYYLVGDMMGWTAETMIKFSHSDKDVYDDPEFSILITTTKEDQYWKIVTQNNVDAGEDGFWAEGTTGVVGVAVNGDDSMSGKLVTTSPQAAKIAKAGMYRITLNMMDYTYEIKEIVPEYYLVGNLQNWSDGAKTCILYPSSKTVFSYTTDFSIDGTKDPNFKIWMGADFGNWNAAYGTAIDGDTSLEGTLVANGGAIMAPTKNEIYTLTVDMVDLTYKMEKIAEQSPTAYQYVSLIGEFNGWGGDADLIQVTPHNWYGEAIEITAGNLKFRANHDWTISWGSVTEGANIGEQNYGTTTTTDGKDMYVPAGTYNVFFNDITGEFVFIVK